MLTFFGKWTVCVLLCSGSLWGSLLRFSELHDCKALKFRAGVCLNGLLIVFWLQHFDRLCFSAARILWKAQFANPQIELWVAHRLCTDLYRSAHPSVRWPNSGSVLVWSRIMTRIPLESSSAHRTHKTHRVQNVKKQTSCRTHALKSPKRLRERLTKCISECVWRKTSFDE